jgi:hypothetical protein
MKSSGRSYARQSARSAASVLTVVAACCGATPQQAVAAQVQAYVIFEIADPSNMSAAVEKLRGTSLSNCLQLIIGSHGLDVLVHIACDERRDRGDTSYLNQAFLALSRVDGVARATIVSLKYGTN